MIYSSIHHNRFIVLSQARRQSFVKGGSNAGVRAREFLKIFIIHDVSMNMISVHRIITFSPNALSSKESMSVLQVLSEQPALNRSKIKEP